MVLPPSDPPVLAGRMAGTRRRSGLVSGAAAHGAGRCGATSWLAPAALALPGAVLVAITGYQTVIGAAAWRARLGGRGRPPLPDVPRHRFLILIPAHNEERLIRAALDSLAALDYPPAL